MSKRDWAKIDVNFWHNRKVKKLTRKYGPVPAAYFFLLVAMSQEASHVEDNPTGEVHCTIQDLIDAYCDRHDRTKMIQQMCEAKLIRITGRGWQEDPEADVTIHLGDSSWITPKGGSAHRMRNKREKDAVLQGSVTGCDERVTASDERVTQTRQDNTIPSKLASEPAPELSRSVDLLFEAFPMVNRNALLMQLVEHSSMDSSPDPRFYLEAAIEIVGNKGSVRNSGGLFNLVVRKAQTKERNLGIDEAQAQKQAARFAPVDDKPVEIPSEVAARLSAWRASEEVAS